MKKHTLLLLLSLFAFLMSEAKIWRVNNNPEVQSDFKQLSEAIISPLVSPGDSIYLEGSPTTYNAATINKKIIIIGTGYFLTDIANEKTQWLKDPAKIQSLSFDQGSSGSKASGLQITGTIDLNDTHLTIERCYIESWLRLGDKPNTTADYDTIRQNFIYGINSREATSTANNVLVYNNIFFSKGFNFSGNIDNTSIYAINNTFLPDTKTGSVAFICRNVLFQNNIIQAPSMGASNLALNQYYNNIISNTAFPSAGNNVQNTEMEQVFVNWNDGDQSPSEGFSKDNRFKLKAGSPGLKGGSINSTMIDCGAFGGSAPYVLSGMPPIPSIFSADIPNLISTPTVNITLSIASH